jgi:hypothetical protein
MRKLLLIATLIYCSVSNAQKITGIGEIKLGRTVSEVKAGLGITDVYIINANKDEDKTLRKDRMVLDRYSSFSYGDKPNSIYKFERVKDEYEWPSAIFERISNKFYGGPGIEIYYLPKYKIASLELRDVYMVFKDGKLSMIEVDPDPSEDLLTALLTKYPTSDTSHIITTIKCKYLYTGAENDKSELRTKASWQNDNAVVKYVYEFKYGQDCKSRIAGYVRFYTPEFLAFSEQFQHEQTDKAKVEGEKIKKSIIDSL